MNKAIRHYGIIESISDDGHIKVRITQLAACADCKVASHCNSSEQKVKIIDVYGSHEADNHYSVGDSVVVTTSASAANRALLFGFGLPLFLLLLTLAAMLAAGIDEGTSALAALAVLAPYYLLIWICGKRIAGSVAFHIEQ